MNLAENADIIRKEGNGYSLKKGKW